MSTSQELSNKNANLFKMLVLVFMPLTAVSAVAYLFLPLVGALLYDVATILLLVGMYSYSRNSEHLNAFLLVAVLFIVGMGLLTVAATYATLYPYQFSPSSSLSSTVNQVGTLEQGAGIHIVGMGVPALFAGLFMALGAYFFSEWFNDAVDKEGSFKTFSYFGIIFFTAELIVFLGYEMLQGTIVATIRESTFGANTLALSVSNYIILFGSLLVLVAFLVEAYAGFQVYKKLSSSS